VRIGFEVVAAAPKGNRASSEDAPGQVPMRGTDPRQVRRNPSTDQKKVRRAQQRKTATQDEESTMTTEADLLAQMAAAPTLAEQRALGARLESFRAQRTAALRAQADLDLGAAVVEAVYPTAPTAQFTQHTAATDWLGEIEPDTHDTRQVEAAARAEATVWFGRVAQTVVKDYPDEIRIQAAGMGSRYASQYGMAAEHARTAYVDQVEHLLSRVAFDEVQKPPYQIPPAEVDYPDNQDTFDDQVSSASGAAEPKTDPGMAPSLSEGNAPQSGTAETNDNPAAENTHSTNGPTNATDYIDGTTTKNTASRVIAARIGQRATCKKCDLDIEYVGTTPDPEKAFLDIDHGSGWWDQGGNFSCPSGGTHEPYIESLASRRTADGRGSADGGDAPSLSEGGSVEGESPQPPVEETFGGISGEDGAHVKDGGNGPATDSIDGTSYQAQSSLREVVAAIEAEGVPESARPFLAALARMDGVTDTFAGYTAAQVAGFLVGHVAASAHAQVLRQVAAGEVPPQFLKNQKPKSDSSDSKNSGNKSGSGQTCAVCGDPIEKDPPSEKPQTWHHDNGEKHDHEAKPKSDSGSKGDSDKGGLPDFLKNKKSFLVVEAADHRPIHQIAAEIEQAWPKVNYAARPYLDAMHSLEGPDDTYGHDGAKGIVAYFLSNARSYTGDAARAHKKELKKIVDDPRGRWSTQGSLAPGNPFARIAAGQDMNVDPEFARRVQANLT
jgi:hypothetical protein